MGGQRVGSGRIRPREVKTLWCQSVFKSQTLTLSKCKSTFNSADLGIKSYTRGLIETVLSGCAVGHDH
eukprot:860417-Amphidinium_carterae.2